MIIKKSVFGTRLKSEVDDADPYSIYLFPTFLKEIRVVQEDAFDKIVWSGLFFKGSRLVPKGVGKELMKEFISPSNTHWRTRMVPYLRAAMVCSVLFIGVYSASLLQGSADFAGGAYCQAAIDPYEEYLSSLEKEAVTPGPAIREAKFDSGVILPSKPDEEIEGLAAFGFNTGVAAKITED